MATSVKNNFLRPSLISNLQQVLISRNDKVEDKHKDSFDLKKKISGNGEDDSVDSNREKPVILVTNGEGTESPGITLLVEALVLHGGYNVHVCAPQADKSVSGHSVTVRETLTVSPVELGGATGYEVSGTPVDCVSLALSGALFSWSKPVLVVSGINRGSTCGHNMFHSGAFAGAREALICGVPSLCISLRWKDMNCETELKDAASVCLPFIDAAIKDIGKGTFPEGCLLNVEIPSYPLRNKGLKVTRQSMWRSSLNCLAVSVNRHPSAGHFMSNQQSLGIKLAQLSRDASAAAGFLRNEEICPISQWKPHYLRFCSLRFKLLILTCLSQGAARRLNSCRQNVEIESVGVAGKINGQQTLKRYFRLEFLEKELENVDEDLDYRALEDGFVAVTPFSLSSTTQAEIQTWVSNWIPFCS